MHAQALYERHHEHLYRHCLRLLGSADEADDAVQQTFLNAIRSLRHGVVPEYETAWLCAIARNVCRDRQRAVARRRRVETPHDLHLIQDRLPDNAGAVDTDIGTLCDALRALDPDQQRAILFREWHGLSHQEIAARLHRSPKAVEALLYRARRSLERTLHPGERLRRGLNLGGLLSLAKTIAPGGLIKTAAVLVATATTIAAAPGSAPADTNHTAALLPRETHATAAVTANHPRPPAQHAPHRSLPTAGPATGPPTARAARPPATTPAATRPPTVPAAGAPQPAATHEAGAAQAKGLPAHEVAPPAPRAEQATADSQADAASPTTPQSAAAKTYTRLETNLLPETLLPETDTLPTFPAPNLALPELPPLPDPTIPAPASLPAGSDDLPSADPLSTDVEETTSTVGEALATPDTSTLGEGITATSTTLTSADTTAAVAAAPSPVDGGAVAG